ncbi:MAG: SoxR reducing system RseC family protein [Sulfuricella denitrificans]|nr:SoxR reducing system RseC family protein [Sulfuricella denitrificans]
MLETEGVVVRLGADGAYVETTRASSCGTCSSQKSCGTSSMSQLLGSKTMSFLVMNPIGAAVGERVVIGLEEPALLKSSLIGYVLPLMLLMAGALGGSQLAPAGAAQDLYPVIGAAVGLGLGIAALKWVAWKTRGQKQFHPVILRRVFSYNIVKLAED